MIVWLFLQPNLPLPPCTTTGLIDLCAPAPVINWPSWFYLQPPNLIWFLALLILLVLGIFLPFRSAEVDSKGYTRPGV